MTDSSPTQRPSVPGGALNSRARPTTDVCPSLPGQQQSGTEITGFNASLDRGLGDPDSSRPEITARGKHGTSPQRAQVFSTGSATRRSFSRTVQPETERASVTHLRRNAISAGMQQQDYRYRSGQPTQRELTEELLGHVQGFFGGWAP